MFVVRHLSVLGVVFVMFFLSLSVYGEEKNEIVMLNWPEYMDFDVVKRFEQTTGIKFRMVLFETDETRDELLAQTNSGSYDIAQITCDRVNGYVKHGWLAPMNATLVPNIKHIGKRWQSEFPEIFSHAITFHWGTLGIAYRPDLLGGKISKWIDLLKPVESLRQKILMEKDSRNLAGMALKASGFSWNAYDEKAVKAASAMLVAQRPYVKTYGYPSIDDKSGLITGDVWAVTLYNGDAVGLQEYEPKIKYIVPEEGALLWMDCLSVLASSKRKPQAYEFINFLHEPENAAQIAKTLHYATTNESALAFLPPEFLNDPVIHPPAEVMSRSEFFNEKWPSKVEKGYKNLLNSLINQGGGTKK
ncbi:MAG: spermidine/putrescine ABC transporter substrate-binding protein [Magnetococcales bacterium]|nr:spermidine/putrescine ABC transporter substrate-binding protein [Magnetococcales bacterium]HIJ84331.1 spermidine/putrescine ABC transporter substrate-binding protein [Magnetococcales bacterium]